LLKYLSGESALGLGWLPAPTVVRPYRFGDLILKRAIGLEYWDNEAPFTYRVIGRKLNLRIVHGAAAA
jgi:hypothetical protein